MVLAPVHSIKCMLTALLVCSSTCIAQWQDHTVRQLNGGAPQVKLSAQFQIVTESWNRVVAVPYIVYMPEKDRLLMLVGCDYPHRAFVLTSDDHGASWTEPRPTSVREDGNPAAGLGTGLAYLGGGTAMFYSDKTFGNALRWFSADHGETWGDPVPLGPAPDGKPWYIWDPPLVDRDPKTGDVTQILETGYFQSRSDYSQGYIRSSSDGGRSWSATTTVPSWKGVNEVALLRTKNGDLLAACRTEPSEDKQQFKDLPEIDHYAGLGVSISEDDGQTWSMVEKLYDFGRHHPSLVLMPDGDIVMTYVVRKGYVDSADGFLQFGIEAVVSKDNGRTWDFDHKYILHTWVSNRKGTNRWWPSSQSTSSQLLPDGSIVTAFGTGYRVQEGQAPRDVGLVHWRLNSIGLNSDSTIRDALFDSDLRNIFDPAS